jgi:hypothetical protein
MPTPSSATLQHSHTANDTPHQHLSQAACAHVKPCTTTDSAPLMRDLGPYLFCYVLTLPLLFLTPPHLLTHLCMKPLIPGTVLLLSLTFLTPFPLTLLIFSLALPLHLLILLPCYGLGHIPLTASLSSAPIVLTGTLQSFGSQSGCHHLDKQLNCLAVGVTPSSFAVCTTCASYMNRASVRGLVGGHRLS